MPPPFTLSRCSSIYTNASFLVRRHGLANGYDVAGGNWIKSRKTIGVRGFRHKYVVESSHPHSYFSIPFLPSIYQIRYNGTTVVNMQPQLISTYIAVIILTLLAPCSVNADTCHLPAAINLWKDLVNYSPPQSIVSSLGPRKITI